MMERNPEKYEDFSYEIEGAYAKKMGEITQIENFFQLNRDLEDEAESDLINKIMIVMLYADFEGFCRKAFQIYLEYVNNTKTEVRKLKDQLAASTLIESFDLLENTNHYPVYSGINFEDNNRIKKYARRVEFISGYSTQMNSLVSIPDKVIDTESNLNPDVMKKIMFNLALDFSKIDSESGNLHMLLGIRNAVAHGDFDRPISNERYKEYRNTVMYLMETIKNELLENYKKMQYLK